MPCCLLLGVFCLHGVPRADGASRPLLVQVGNEGQPTNTSFIIDTTPPTFTSINYPRGSNQPDITVTFEVNDGKRWAGKEGLTVRRSGGPCTTAACWSTAICLWRGTALVWCMLGIRAVGNSLSLAVP